MSISSSAGLTNQGQNSIAIGLNSDGTGTSSVAIGYNATTSTYNSAVALGTGATSTANNSFVVSNVRTIAPVSTDFYLFYNDTTKEVFKSELGTVYSPTITWVTGTAYSTIGTSPTLPAGVYQAIIGINFGGTFPANNYIYPTGIGDLRFPIIQNSGNGQVAIASGSYVFKLTTSGTTEMRVGGVNSLSISTYIWTIIRIA